jgi:hypothetical protein
MQTIIRRIKGECEKAGIENFTVKGFPGEGYQVNVTRLADVFTAEEVAKRIHSLYGAEVLVGF